MASGLEKVGGLLLSALRNMCGVFELKAVQVTKGFVNEDGYLELFESNVLLFIPHLCWELRIFPALWFQHIPIFFLLKVRKLISCRKEYIKSKDVTEVCGCVLLLPN